ncbi:MAG: ATP-binding protein [Bacillota bacterium]
MSKMFVNREKELSFLEGEFKKEGASLVIIYGRRRIGKTSLIKKFIEQKAALYFLATEESERENIASLQNILADYTGNNLLRSGANFSWDDLFITFRDYKRNEKKILIIDEFQYLGKANSSFPSVFQRIWDERLKDTNIMVILCGSLIHMMESQTLAYSSPLYGRRTGQIKLTQVPFLHYKEFFKDKDKDKDKDKEELIEYYAVTGGVPKYIEAFQDLGDVYIGITKNILSKQSYLYEEPIFLLGKEVSEIGSYFSIIKTIAQGNHKLGNIAKVLGVSQTNLTKYLNTLINLDLIERQVPITERNLEKSKKGLYFLKDNFIEFWFKFVYPYRSYIEMEHIEHVVEKIKSNFIDNHVSHIYEKVCMEKIWQLNYENRFFFKVLKMGKWWDNREEIDIVGFNEDSKEIFFCECKYHNKPVDVDVYYQLNEKVKKVDWHNKTRKEYFVICSKSGFSEKLVSIADIQKNLLLLN